MEELFDVVDESDRVVGTFSRAEVHRLGLKHRATHVLIFNARGELFLQQRSLSKDMWPGVWDSSVSGHVDHGEDYDSCAQRELCEELGLSPGLVPERWFKLEASEATGQEFCWVYFLWHEGPFRFQESELRGGGWFRPKTIQHWVEEFPEDFASGFREIWRTLEPRRAQQGQTNPTSATSLTEGWLPPRSNPAHS